LGFDWHSSGVTTVTCGAQKEAARVCGPDLGILLAGGKGGTSRKTPQESAAAADRHAIASGERLVYASRMSTHEPRRTAMHEILRKSARERFVAAIGPFHAPYGLRTCRYRRTVGNSAPMPSRSLVR
jgi:hypothetical protein